MATLDIPTLLAQPDAPPSWVVEGLLLQGQAIALAGEPGVGKSILAYTLALAVACELPFLGRLTATGPVLYFDEENSYPDALEYLRWAWRGLGCPAIQQLNRLRFEHFSLAGKGVQRWEYMETCASAHHPLLIVIDTATPACNIQKEEDNAEASRAIRHLRRVQAVAGPQCALLILKHAKFTHEKGDRRTVRGAKTWEGELDALLFHTAPPGARRKDGLRPSFLEPSKVRAFGLRQQVRIEPAWVTTDSGKGLAFSAPEWPPSSAQQRRTSGAGDSAPDDSPQKSGGE